MIRRNLFWILFAAAVIGLAYYFSVIVGYILIAWVLSMLGSPLMRFFQSRIRIRKWQMGPSSAALLTLFTFYLMIAGLLLIFVPTIVSQARHLASVDYQTLGEKMKEPFTNLDGQMHQIGLLDPGESLGTRIQELLSEWFHPTMLGDFLGSFISTAGNIVVAFASVSFILFFFLKDQRLFINLLQSLVPDELEEKVLNTVQSSSNMLTRYFTGLAIQTLTFIAIVTIVLWILGVPNALLIGVAGGIFNIIPYIGPIIGNVLGCFFTLSSYIESDIGLIIPQLLKVIGAFAFTQLIDNNLVGPYITSTSVKAHPLEVFIVTLIAAQVGGIGGMILGVPVYTVLRLTARIFFSEFKMVKRLTREGES